MCLTYRLAQRVLVPSVKKNVLLPFFPPHFGQKKWGYVYTNSVCGIRAFSVDKWVYPLKQWCLKYGVTLHRRPSQLLLFAHPLLSAH